MLHKKTLQVDEPDYYEVYAGSARGGPVCIDDADFWRLMSLLEKSALANDSVEVISYCLSPDRFYLLILQKQDGGGMRLMHDIITGYNKYFFDRYDTKSLISEDDYNVSVVHPDDLLDVSRQIHTKAEDWMDCQYSSIRAYFYDDTPKWLNKTPITSVYGSAVRYHKYIDDYQIIHENLDV